MSKKELETLERREKVKGLKAELQKLERLDEKHKEELKLQKNYERFLRRPSDQIIGKGHYENGVDKHGYSNYRKGFSRHYVEIKGNCGTVYYPEAYITRTTERYFHNVWTETQKYQFREKLNNMIHEEIDKIISSPTCVIQLMGLEWRSDMSLKDEYPEDKIPEIKRMIKEERFKVLNKFKVEELVELYSRFHTISHGKSILREYLEDKKEELKKMELKCLRCHHTVVNYFRWISRKQCENCDYKDWQEEHNDSD